MANALRQVLYEEIAGGYFKFLNHSTEIGSDGFAGFLYYVPVSQNCWVWEQDSGGHQLSEEWDTNRQLTRVTSILAAAHSSYLDMRILLPYDFGSFPANAISLIVRMNDITGPALTANLYNAGGIDAGITAVDILPLIVNTYTLTQLTPADVYAPGDYVTLDIEFTNDAVSQNVDVVDLSIAYVSARGNV